MSCHTGVLYLMARPALRRSLGQSKPTEWETGLLSGLDQRLKAADGKHMFPGFSKEPLASQSIGVEAILAAYHLRDRASLDRLWATQIHEGEDAGAWKWLDVSLNPWETPASKFFGAALAAVAAGEAPHEALSNSAGKTGMRELTAYLLREAASQPFTTG